MNKENSKKFFPQEIIRKKRDGSSLTEDEIGFFIDGLNTESIQDSQAAALAMSIYFQGMNMQETISLTKAMLNSGGSIEWNKHELSGPIIDKHSTGGVGDKVSLILAPLLASCGCFVPMISGRGLGHTGGTLDKMDSIPGYVSQPDKEKFQSVVKKVGCAIIGQTQDLAPADGKLYAIRDITATVESIPLITASILSKKLAAGLDVLVMDIKTGNGAFANSLEISTKLAESITTVSNGAGLPCTALITDMNQVLGKNAGNAIEIEEVIKFFKDDVYDLRLYEVTISLCSELLVNSGVVESNDSARNLLNKSLNSGKAAEKFEKMVFELGGPINILDNYEAHLPKASIKRPVFHPLEGKVSQIDTRKLGLIIMSLGGGRKKNNDKINYSVGLSDIVSLGDKIYKEKPLCFIHAENESDAQVCEKRIIESIKLADDYQTKQTIIYDKILPTP